MIPRTGERPTVVLRIIARLNVGGPAIQAINLTKRLEPHGYRTVLLRGREGASEGSMDYLADALGVRPVPVRGLRRAIGLHDLAALASVMRWIRRERPQVLHTHTAKAGAIGRIAAMLLPRSRPPVIVHTFHGHVLEGEFSPRMSRVIAFAERILARRATQLIAVSEEIRADLVRFGVAPAEKIAVVRLGFDLSAFALQGPERDAIRHATRTRLGIPADVPVVSLIARVVKVKRVDRFLEMAARLADRYPDARFVVAGDGDRRSMLEQSDVARRLGDRLVWTGFERDVAGICFASDVVTLTSDNEGTPVCLIEAQAAGVPVVTTDVGGVRTVVLDGVSGRVVDRDAGALADAAAELLDDPGDAAERGAAGREHVLATFSIERLVDDIQRLYAELLGRRLDGAPAALPPAMQPVGTD